MIAINSQQWYAWVATFFWPFLRVLGLVIAEPVLGNRGIPMTTKVGLSIVVALLLTPVLPPMARIDPGSAAGVLIGVQQLLVGLAMGFTIRIALTAVQMAGQLSGLQMSLGAAVLYDPRVSGQTVALGQFLGLFAILGFLSVDGHHVVIKALAESFGALPISQAPLNPLGWRVLFDWSGAIFRAGLLISLPLIAALLLANIAVGIMTRAAPQLNIFSVGFPLTLITGLVALYLAAPYIGPAVHDLFEEALLAMGRVVQGFAAP
jgi:flagellar biosynthetic protein FliR